MTTNRMCCPGFAGGETYATEEQAKEAARKDLSPFVVELPDGEGYVGSRPASRGSESVPRSRETRGCWRGGLPSARRAFGVLFRQSSVPPSICSPTAASQIATGTDAFHTRRRVATWGLREACRGSGFDRLLTADS